MSFLGDGLRDAIHLTAEQEHEAEKIAGILREVMQEEAQNIGRLLASKANSELFGQTEFPLRDILLRLGTRSIEAALSERKKGGTKDPA